MRPSSFLADIFASQIGVEGIVVLPIGQDDPEPWRFDRITGFSLLRNPQAAIRPDDFLKREKGDLAGG